MDHLRGSPGEEAELTSNFDKSAATVHDLVRRLENDAVRPFVQYLIDSFRQHPIRSTYLTILAALCLFPVLSFVGFSLFTFTSFICIALTAAVICATMVVALSGTLFLGTLFLLVGVAIFLTASALGMYLFVRLALLTYDAGPRAGILEWANESRKQLLPSRLHPADPDCDETKPKENLEGRSRDELAVGKIPAGNFTVSLEDGLTGDGAVGADLGSPPTVAKRELEKE